MSKILLKDNSTGADITIEQALLLTAYAVSSVTKVEYLDDEDGYLRTANVTDTVASVITQSNVLISLTEKDSGATIGVNKDRITDIGEISSQAVLSFDAAGASLRRINVTETAVAVKNKVITKEGDLSYLIDSFTASPNVVVLDASVGDVSSNFVNGSVFTVFGEGDSNDGIYTVSSVAFDGTNTKITVVETPTANASASGYTWIDVAEANTAPSSYSPGVAATGVTATHYSSDGKNFVTKLTVAQTDAFTVADNAALADGSLLYTFPAGAYAVSSVKMDLAVTLAEDTAQAAADLGLGSVVGSGAVAILSGTPTFEDYLTGQTPADCNGTSTLKTVSSTKVVEAADAHTLYANIAATWNDTAGADLTGDLAGEVWFTWSLLD